MTQQQIGYMNAVTNRKQLDIASRTANAAEIQAAASMKQANNATKRTTLDFWTGLGTTALGLTLGFLL